MNTTHKATAYMEEYDRASSRGDETEAAKMLNDAREEFSGGYSAAPTGEDKRPAFERTGYAPIEVPFNQILELWAAHEGGRLLRVINVAGKVEARVGEDDARRAWEWVSGVPGWSKVVHEVMRHLILRNRAWTEWPVAPSVKCQRVIVGDESGEHRVEHWSYCDWPFVTYDQAGASWAPFYRALRKKYRRDPFVIRSQTIEFA